MSNITPPTAINGRGLTGESTSNKLQSYKLTPPKDRDINPLINTAVDEKNKRIKLSKDYPDFLPWVHTNPKINNIYLNNLINGYTTSDLLSKNPLNEDRKMFITTNSNSNGNNTSTTSLGENESGFKLFKINYNSKLNDEPNSTGANSPPSVQANEDMVDLNAVLDEVMSSFKSINHIRYNIVNKNKLLPSLHHAAEIQATDADGLVKALHLIIDQNKRPELFISESIIRQIISFNCDDWSEYMVRVLNEIFAPSENNETFNLKFQVYWKLLNIMIYDLKVLRPDSFYFNWLLPFISNTQSLLENGTIINDKLPIIKFITLKVVLNFLPENKKIILNDLLLSLIKLTIPQDSKFNNIVNNKLINPLIASLFNQRNLCNYKLLNESVSNHSDEEKNIFMNDLRVQLDTWVFIYTYLKDCPNVNLLKLDEANMWNESIALKYLHILPKQPDNLKTGTVATDHGLKLTSDCKLILTQEFDPLNLLSHSILKIISDFNDGVDSFIFYQNIQICSLNPKFQEDQYWSILITLVLKTKLDINIMNLIVLTNHLISLKKLNPNNFFLKLISSGVLHNSYIEKFGIFLINLNISNNLKQYDSILSKYFKHLFNDYNSSKLNEIIISEAEDKNTVVSVLISKSNNFLNKLLFESNSDQIDCEAIIAFEKKFVRDYKGQYNNFWVFINHLLCNDKITNFKTFKLILYYVISYKPDASFIDFNLVYDYYMRLEQSMILKDMQFSEKNNLKLQYDFNVNLLSVNISTIMTTDNNIYNFEKIWKDLASIYITEQAIFNKLKMYEEAKQNNILTYNLLKENIPSNILHLKDDVSNHGTLQQFLTKTFREYFNHKNHIAYLTNIKFISVKFTKTLNNYIPYFIKRLKLDSHDNEVSFFEKIILLLNDDILSVDVLFNRLPIDDVVNFMNYILTTEKQQPLINHQLCHWVVRDDETIIKILENKNIRENISCLIVNTFIEDKSNVLSKWLINEKKLLCDLLKINYNDWFLKLNEENIFTQLIYNLNFTNFRYMKLLLNEFINNLKIEEIMSIIKNLNGDFIIKNFLIIDFNTIEDFGNDLLNEFLNKVLDFEEDELLIHLINNNIKLNENCLKNFTISQSNLKKIITKLSFIKQNNDQCSLEKIFQVMLLYNIKDIKLNIKNNASNKVGNSYATSNGMSLKNRILASLVNDKLHMENDSSTNFDEAYEKPRKYGIGQGAEVVYLRSND